jgi:acetylornithine deacetylase/succinyl-diaminopimelate desuccinylase-like protein
MAGLAPRIAALAAEDLPLARALLAELIRVPAEVVSRLVEDGGDPACGLSNHEGPRLRALRRRIVDLGAVRRPEDVFLDGFGNLVWTVDDPSDGIPPARKRVIWWDGHADTATALRPRWRSSSGGGLDPYLGLVDPTAVDEGFLERELGWLPPREAWDHLVFGRGAADQLGGLAAQVIASRILLRLAPEGALRGVIVRSYATVAEEDNDGGGPRHVVRHELPSAPPERIPDVVILTESTGSADHGALGIYRGQRGRMQIEVEVRGRSCHGSMPWMGLNPLEHGGAILAEAARRTEAREGFLDHPFLGHGTRTASWARLDTPSDCEVPERFLFRFDRRLTVGETPERAVADVEGLDAVAAARAAGLGVTVSVPRYTTPTWTGVRPDNPAVYLGWETPADHPAVVAAAAAYRDVISPQVPDGVPGGGLQHEPRLGAWLFSTDGVGYLIPETDTSIPAGPAKRWVTSGAVRHPAMFGLGPGIEENTHKIGECVDVREVQHAAAFLAHYPSRLTSPEG